jgi:hypothetical protein
MLLPCLVFLAMAQAHRRSRVRRAGENQRYKDRRYQYHQQILQTRPRRRSVLSELRCSLECQDERRPVVGRGSL